MRKRVKKLTEEEFKERSEKLKALQPEGKTPFVYIPAVCPICGEESAQRYFKTDAYTVAEKALDLRPTKYVFEDPDFAHYLPPLYYIWQCPKCFFSADEKTFEDPVSDVICTLNNFRKRLLESYSTDETFKKIAIALTGAKEGEQIYFKAIKEYLMAIHQFQSVASVRERDALVLARICIHLAWLYQDLADSKQATSTKILLDQLKYSIIFDWEDVPLDTESALKLALHYYDVTYFASTILTEKKIDHNILQIIGRLNVVLGDIGEGRKVFLKGIMVANKYRKEFEDKLKDKFITKDMQEDIMPKMYLLDSFIKESQELLYESKQMLKKGK